MSLSLDNVVSLASDKATVFSFIVTVLYHFLSFCLYKLKNKKGGEGRGEVERREQRNLMFSIWHRTSDSIQSVDWIPAVSGR